MKKLFKGLTKAASFTHKAKPTAPAAEKEDKDASLKRSQSTAASNASASKTKSASEQPIAPAPIESPKGGKGIKGVLPPPTSKKDSKKDAGKPPAAPAAKKEAKEPKAAKEPKEQKPKKELKEFADDEIEDDPAPSLTRKESEPAPDEGSELQPGKTSKVLEGLKAKTEAELEAELETAMEENFKLNEEYKLLLEMLAASRLDEAKLEKDLKLRQKELTKLKAS